MRLREALHDLITPKPQLTEAEIRDGMRWSTRNGVAIQVMETLTVGALLTAFALELGASNLMIGVLAAIPNIAQLAQLGGVHIVERTRRRKSMTLIASLVARPMLLVMAAAAFMAGTPWGLGVLTIGFALRYLAGAFIGCSWNAWMRQLIPQNELGSFYSNKLLRMTLMSAVGGLLAAGFIDLWQEFDVAPSRYAYAVLLVIGAGFGLYSIYTAAKVPEPEMEGGDRDMALWHRLSIPLKDRNFRGYLSFMGSWNFAVNLAAPFFVVHMLQRLGLELSIVIGLTIVSQFANVLVIRRWGSIADRLSNKAVLGFCGPLFVLCIFAWIFTTVPESPTYTILLLVAIHILTGIATAGVTLSTGNIGLKLAPQEDAASYLAVNGVVVALAAGIAPIIGGLTADFFMSHELSLTLAWRSPDETLSLEAIRISQWGFFFLLATIIGLFSLQRLSAVRETESDDERVLLSQLLSGAGRSVRAFSSVAGLRAMTEMPMELLRQSLKKR